MPLQWKRQIPTTRDVQATYPYYKMAFYFGWLEFLGHQEK